MFINYLCFDDFIENCKKDWNLKNNVIFFLMVGYIYEDIDVCFSKVVDKLWRNDVEMFNDFVVLLLSVIVINYVYDVWIWI